MFMDTTLFCYQIIRCTFIDISVSIPNIHVLFKIPIRGSIFAHSVTKNKKDFSIGTLIQNTLFKSLYSFICQPHYQSGLSIDEMYVQRDPILKFTVKIFKKEFEKKSMKKTPVTCDFFNISFAVFISLTNEYKVKMYRLNSHFKRKSNFS